MELFYIIREEQKSGPFDMVSMITKIKNGRLLPTDRVLREGEDSPVSANDIKVFHEYFLDMEYTAPQEHPLKNAGAPTRPKGKAMQRLEAFFSVRSNAIAVAVGVFLFFFILLLSAIA